METRFGAEVQEESELQVGTSQIAVELVAGAHMKLDGRLDLDDEPVVYDQIYPLTAKHPLIVLNSVPAIP